MFVKSLIVLQIFCLSVLASGEIAPNQLEFFEKKVRPVFEKHCYKCHSETSKKLKGKLLLDSKAGWQKGGDSGQSVVVPGNATQSLLIKMINHQPEVEQMPTKYKMKPEEIQAIEMWVKMGAPDPRTQEISAKYSKKEFDLEERKKWWSLQALKDVKVPKVQNSAWIRNDIDSFILNKLEDKKWVPARAADARTLLRRVSFTLTGLPPTVEEMNQFLADKSPKAFEKAVDRLLASKHFGEHWARHWMDVVRYAETKAFEADYTMPHAAEYRDYLIRAFNNDIPYDRFILEALAGDLIPPRFDSQTGNNESLSGTGYIYLTDGQHGPPDLHGDEVRVFDGMIDVVTKAFTGLTVACARCHDHKFDAITAKDYYSLYGILSSSRLHHANISNPKKQDDVLVQLKPLKAQIINEFRSNLESSIEQLPDYLGALRKDLLDKQDVVPYLEEKRLSKEKYARLKKLVTDKKKLSRVSGLRTLMNFTLAKSGRVLKGLKNKFKKPQEHKDFFELSETSLGELLVSGKAFETLPVKSGSVVLNANGPQVIQAVLGDEPVAGLYSSRQGGVLRTPDFKLDESVSLYVKGQNASVSLIIRNYEQAGKGPTTGRLRIEVNNNNWQRVLFHTQLWKGEKAYLEIMQNGGSIEFVKNNQYHYNHNENSYVAVKGFNAYDGHGVWSSFKPESLGKVIANLATHIDAMVKKWSQGKLNSDEAEFITSLLNIGLLENPATNPTLKSLIDKYRKEALNMPKPIYTRSLVDGTPQDEVVYIRGNHKTLSNKSNPRHFLDGINGEAFKTKGSGRLEWAKELVDENNPLTARVMVNRLWHHIFGRGLVYSTNNFGKLGRLPTHPELLDYLAKDFMKSDWSLKQMIRKMVLSSTFRMSSQASEATMKTDPENDLLQHMSARRITAEMIRDNILQTTGSLDRTLYGASIPANVRGMPGSRAIPKKSGPIDGANRRSVYQELRRNYLPPFFMAFDMPNATESIGRRNVTNVPAQSLVLLNDPFVQEQAKRWATKYAADSRSFEQKIESIHQEAFARPASAAEQLWAKQTFQDLAKVKKSPESSISVWQEFCHMMLNRKEFIYLF